MLFLNSRIKRLSREFSWIVAGQIAAVIGSLVLLRALTEMLLPSQFGELALSLTVVGLINAVIMGGIVNGAGRFFSVAAEQNDVLDYLRASFKLLIYATVAIIFIAIFLVTLLVWTAHTKWIGLFLAALVFSLLSGYIATISSIQNAARQRSIVALHSGIDPWLKSLIVVCAAIWVSISSITVLICYAIVSLIILISQLFFFRLLPKINNAKNPQSAHEDWIEKIWQYSWPFMLWGVFGWAQISSTRWALQMFSTTEDVGYYSVLSQLGYVPIQILIGMFMTFLNPIIFAMAGNANDEARRKNVSKLVNQIFFVGTVLTILATLVTSIFHYQILQIFVSEEYWLVSNYLPVLVAAGGVFGIALVVASKHMSFMSTRQMLPASIGSSLIGFCASFIGVYFYSFAGATFAMLIHSVSYLILLQMISSRKAAKNASY